MQITFDLRLFADRHPKKVRVGRGRKVAMGLNRRESEKALLYLLEAGITVNRMQLRQNRDIPPLYKAGVRYVREKTEIWQDCVVTFDRGEGDCEDLSMWRIAELRNNGKRAEPYISWRMNGDLMVYHVKLIRAGGKFEDPSKILGM